MKLINKKNELVIKYFENKEYGVRSETNYKDGKPHGKEIIYWEGGKKHKVWNYKKGLLHGDFENFNPNGTLYSNGKFKEGKIKECHYYCHINNQKQQSMIFKKGLIEVIDYNPENGKIVSTKNIIPEKH
tara:strand:+ start:115 stop:501 length:387 start_codon:yes stop_codon:yes gene_type:complete